MKRISMLTLAVIAVIVARVLVSSFTAGLASDTINANKPTSELNLFASVRVVHGRTK